MAHRHIDLGPLSRRAQREARTPQHRRASARLDSRHHLEELRTTGRSTGTTATAKPDGCHDPRTGRPLDGAHEALETLSERDLQRELTIAALASSRHDRFQRLLAERERRRPKSAPWWKRALLSIAIATDQD